MCISHILYEFESCTYKPPWRKYTLLLLLW